MVEYVKYFYYVNVEKREIVFVGRKALKETDIPEGFEYLGASEFPNKEIIVSRMLGKKEIKQVTGYSFKELY